MIFPSQTKEDEILMDLNQATLLVQNFKVLFLY